MAIPKPFILVNITKTTEILEGNDQKVSIAAIGDVPDSIILNYKINKEIHQKKIGGKNEIFNFTFNNMQYDIIWWTNFYATSIFSPWDIIESKIDTISVIKRPVISNLEFILSPA